MAGRRRTGEFDLIERFFRPLSRAAPGAFALRNDGALLTPPAGASLVVTKDLMVAGVHYPEGEEPATVARRLLRVNLSDLAAMGATATALRARPRAARGYRRCLGGGVRRRPRPRSGGLRCRADRRRHGGDEGAGGALADRLWHGRRRCLPHPRGRGRRRRHLCLRNRRRRDTGLARRARRPRGPHDRGPRSTCRALPPARTPPRARRGARR